MKGGTQSAGREKEERETSSNTLLITHYINKARRVREESIRAIQRREKNKLSVRTAGSESIRGRKKFFGFRCCATARITQEQIGHLTRGGKRMGPPKKSSRTPGNLKEKS